MKDLTARTILKGPNSASSNSSGGRAAHQLRLKWIEVVPSIIFFIIIAIIMVLAVRDYQKILEIYKNLIHWV